jgi:hypothetical protein
MALVRKFFRWIQGVIVKKIFSKTFLGILFCGFLVACGEGSAEQQNRQREGGALYSLPFLVVDLDGDGILMIYEHKIDAGEAKILDIGKRHQVMATRGLATLHNFDTNKNRVIEFVFRPRNDDDNVPAGFRVWQDKNQNAFMEKVEQLKMALLQKILEPQHIVFSSGLVGAAYCA